MNEIEEKQKKLEPQKKLFSRPVRRCAAYGCPVNSEKYPHIKLFNFPRQHDGKLVRYYKWVQFSNNPTLKSGKVRSASLCSKHFTNKQFRNFKRELLRSNAVPSIPVSKFVKPKHFEKSVAMTVKNKTARKVRNEENKLVAYNTETYVTFNHNFKNHLENESTMEVVAIKDDCTSLTVNALSRLFGKPPDVTSGWTDEEKLAAISHELNQIDAEIRNLNKRESELIALREQLTDKALLEKSKVLADKDWDRTDFPWYGKLKDALNNVFKIKELRTHQLPTMNATLSKHDAILIMPTGGGKSLCYQLPALIDEGITIVISPLVSLMEDQVMALKNLNVDVGMFHADCDKTEANRLMQAMTDKKSDLKLIYLTPEKLARSKRFMSKLQKCHEMGRLSRIAIDEVHCCSQWGHDFRPDYKFLGVLKSVFPEVPLLGLTATATTKVTLDVQKMLDIQGCTVFKASFNRPNLYYEVRPKPSSQKECIDELEDLLKHKYANQSGIIYTTTVKDCADLREELRKRGLKVSGYHANLDPNQRSSVHRKWMTGEYQAVVATIAFGLGIDKPDVRFVIHHALSKSMENFYQESGRAGRDGNRADCVLFYRLGDMFKLSTMVFSQQTGLKCLYGIVGYCLDVHRLSPHFDESWESTDCNGMCDHCRNPRQPKQVNITKHCHTIYKLFANAAKCDTKLTVRKLLEAWYGKGPAQLHSSDISTPSFSRVVGEGIVGYLIIKDYIKEDFHFTPYSTISYLRRGSMAAKLSDPNHQIAMTVRGKSVSQEANDKSEESSKASVKAITKKRQKSDDNSAQQTKRRVITIDSDSE